MPASWIAERFPREWARARNVPKRSAADFVKIVGLDPHIPEEGWTEASFAKHGVGMIKAAVRTARYVEARSIPVVSKAAFTIFQEQTEATLELWLASIERMAGGTPEERAVKGAVKGWYGDEPVNENYATLWEAAVREATKNSEKELVVKLAPPVQSVMGRGYSQNVKLLKQKPSPKSSQALTRKARAIAQSIAGVSETTRKRLKGVIQRAAKAGISVSETARRLRRIAPRINKARALTIARTELKKAWTVGTAQAFVESKTLTHFSVIGCMAREPGSPHYRGESTCNIEDVPIEEINAFLEVGFHINHSGVLVASRFRKEKPKQ